MGGSPASGSDATFRSFWHGPELTPLERLCIQSFLAHGHRFVLYAYQEVGNVPSGCGLEDAAGILPVDHLFLHREGIHAESVAGFSDVFRYHLLRQRGGWWVDTDVVCLRADIRETDYVFAENEPGVLNGAILRAPMDSRLLAEACRRAGLAGKDPAYGSVGPDLLTELVTELGLAAHAWPRDELYPIGWDEALDVLDPSRRAAVEERSRASSFFHLWNEIFRLHNVLKTVRPPHGSFLADLYERYEIGFPAAPRYTFSDLRSQLWVHERHLAMREELTRLYEELAAVRGELEAERSRR